jgi:hypothetical protein
MRTADASRAEDVAAAALFDLLADLGDVAAQKVLGGFARARCGVTDGEQLADLRQPQPEPLRAPDEQQPVHVGRPVPAMSPSVRCGTGSRPSRS